MINDRLANCNEIDEEEIIPLRRKLNTKNNKTTRMREIIDREINLRSFRKLQKGLRKVAGSVLHEELEKLKKLRKDDVNNISQALYIGDHPQFKGNKK